jgi:hypothetical protein
LIKSICFADAAWIAATINISLAFFFFFKKKKKTVICTLNERKDKG